MGSPVLVDTIQACEGRIERLLSDVGYGLGDFPISREDAEQLLRTAYCFGYERALTYPAEVDVGEAIAAYGRARLPIE